MLKTSDRPQRRGNLLLLSTLAVDLSTVAGLDRYSDQGITFVLDGGAKMMEVKTLQPGDHETILGWWTEIRFGQVELPEVDELDYSDPCAVARIFERRFGKRIAEVRLDTEVRGFNILEWHGSRGGGPVLRFHIDTDRKERGMSGGRNDMWFSPTGVKSYVYQMTDDEKTELEAACIRALPELHRKLAAELSGGEA